MKTHTVSTPESSLGHTGLGKCYNHHMIDLYLIPHSRLMLTDSQSLMIQATGKDTLHSLPDHVELGE